MKFAKFCVLFTNNMFFITKYCEEKHIVTKKIEYAKKDF
jgi:hypothetical protein